MTALNRGKGLHPEDRGEGKICKHLEKIKKEILYKQGKEEGFRTLALK